LAVSIWTNCVEKHLTSARLLRTRSASGPNGESRLAHGQKGTGHPGHGQDCYESHEPSK
jgi:hypothetical protein